MSPGIYEIDAVEINQNGVLIHEFGKTQQKESLLSKKTVQHTDLQNFQIVLLFYDCRFMGSKHSCLTIKHHENEIHFLSLKR